MRFETMTRERFAGLYPIGEIVAVVFLIIDLTALGQLLSAPISTQPRATCPKAGDSYFEISGYKMFGSSNGGRKLPIPMFFCSNDKPNHRIFVFLLESILNTQIVPNRIVFVNILDPLRTGRIERCHAI